MKQIRLIILVFISGASLMIIELVASRILAPFVGTSLIVWTILIGVILGALSLGYWAGGRFADQNPSLQKLGMICMLAGLFVALALWISSLISYINLFLISTFSLAGAAVILSGALFIIPSILLGAISPYALRLSFTETKNSGSIAGKLYAFSTIGSIVGTFAAGFLFIPYLGSFKTLALVSIIMVLLGLSFFRSRVTMGLFIVVCFFNTLVISQSKIFLPSKLVFAEYESAYNRLFLANQIDPITKRPTINIMSGPHLSQSARFTDGNDDLVFEYTKFFRLANYLNSKIGKALMIGGGAYSVPKDFIASHPEASMDVVEIDPLYTELAQKYFDLKSSDRMRIFHQDGRIFLQSSKQRYDAIFIDAFNNAGSVPFHLATKEAVQAVYDHLSDNGVVIVNIVAALQGPSSKFMNSEYSTYASVFENVAIFPLAGVDSANIQNIMLVASKKDLWPTKELDSKEFQGFVNKRYHYVSDVKVLTDDWAPVDYYLSGLY